MAPLSVASSRLSLSSTTRGSRLTLRKSPTLPVPFAANPGPKVNFPWVSPAVVRSPVCLACGYRKRSTCSPEANLGKPSGAGIMSLLPSGDGRGFMSPNCRNV